MGKSLTFFKKIFMSALILMQNQAPDIFVFMAQNPQTPLNGWKWAFLSVIWPSHQISGQKCGRIFDNFQKNFHVSTVSDAKSGAWHICIYGSRPSDPSKWVKMGVFTCNLTKCGRIFDVFAYYRTHMWVNLYQFLLNLMFSDWFLCKIGCPTYLWIDTLRPP